MEKTNRWIKKARGWLGSALTIAALMSTALAAEKGGLLVDVQKKILSRNDQATPLGSGSMNVNRTLSLKVDIKNTSMRDMPQTQANYVVLVQRWGTEVGSVERFEGTAKVDALAVAHSASFNLGEFHIGGHLHGGSEIHVDKMVAWKVTIERDGKPLEFTSSSSFESLNKKATRGSQ